jgi:hypothetical protein
MCIRGGCLHRMPTGRRPSTWWDRSRMLPPMARISMPNVSMWLCASGSRRQEESRRRPATSWPRVSRQIEVPLGPLSPLGSPQRMSTGWRAEMRAPASARVRRDTSMSSHGDETSQALPARSAPPSIDPSGRSVNAGRKTARQSMPTRSYTIGVELLSTDPGMSKERHPAELSHAVPGQGGREQRASPWKV